MILWLSGFFLAHCELRCERDLSVFLALVDTLGRPSSTGPMTWFALTHRHDASVSKSQLKNNHSALTLQARALTIKQATETDLSCLTRHVTDVLRTTFGPTDARVDSWPVQLPIGTSTPGHMDDRSAFWYFVGELDLA